VREVLGGEVLGGGGGGVSTPKHLEAP
jgi:hypothetical protein